MPYGYIQNRHDKKVFYERQKGKNFNEPDIYNKSGEKYSVFYLRDEVIGNNFYSYTRYRFPKRIFWDKSNPFLSKHFYGHTDIGHFVGDPDIAYAILVETESILPSPYKKLLLNPELAKEYKYIFTHSERILNKFPNAKFIPAGGVWYGLPQHGGVISDDLYLSKKKNISMVSSNKTMCDLHRIRIDTAIQCKKSGFVDTFGNFDGGAIIPIGATLQNYRYSIVFENTITDYCFTEKILNCFKSMTIPIYYGASKIAEFFNADGIIFIEKNNISKSIAEIIHSVDEKYYSNHISAILDNYKRVKDYTCHEDYITSHYLDVFTNK